MRLNRAREDQVIGCQPAFGKDVGLVKLVILFEPDIALWARTVTALQKDGLADRGILLTLGFALHRDALRDVVIGRWIVENFALLR